MEWPTFTASFGTCISHNQIQIHWRNFMFVNQSLLVPADRSAARTDSEWEGLLHLLNAVFSFHMSQLNSARSIALLNRNNVPIGGAERGVTSD